MENVKVDHVFFKHRLSSSCSACMKICENYDIKQKMELEYDTVMIHATGSNVNFVKWIKTYYYELMK
jgi:hypothetical protein